MTYINILICLSMALLGIVAHVFGVKIPSFKTRTQVANLQFSYSNYFQDDLSAIIASVAIVLATLLITPTAVAKWHPDLIMLYGIFFFLGFTDSSILIAKLGKADAKLNAVVDEKTNIADELLPPVTK